MPATESHASVFCLDDLVPGQGFVGSTRLRADVERMQSFAAA